MLVPFTFGAVRAKNGLYGFLLPAASMGMLWFTASVYDYFTGSRIIAFRVADTITSGSVVLLFALTIVVAALPAAIAGAAGYSMRRAIRK